MVEVVHWTTRQLEAEHALAGSTRPPIPRASIYNEETETPDFGETFAAGFERENMIAEGVKELDLRERRGLLRGPRTEGDLYAIDPPDDEPILEEADPDFNVYRHLRQSLSDEDLEIFEPVIRAGLFDGIHSAQNADFKVERLRREMQLLETIEIGSAVGQVLGSIAGVAVDITTFLPVAPAFRTVRAGSLTGTLRGALLTTTAAAVPELGLQAAQDLRTAQESFLNIGTAGVIGGGVGAFMGAFSRRSRLNPDHPENPFNVDNADSDPVRVRNPDGTFDDIPGRSAGDAGAAAAPSAPGAALRGKGAAAVGRFVGAATPAGRALHYTSARGREVLLKLMDVGGILSDRMGHVFAPSAEDIKKDWLRNVHSLFLFGDNTLRTLNQEIGRPGVLGVGRGVDEDSFNEVARKILTKTFSEADADALTKQYGAEASRAIQANATTYANKIHQLNNLFADEMSRLGILRDEEKIVDLEGRIGALDSQLDAAARQRAGAEAQGEPAPEIDTSAVKEEKARLQADLDRELKKAPHLGEDYGHAQLYDGAVVLQKQEEFEDWLLDVLVDKPDEDWLYERFRITPDEWLDLSATGRLEKAAAGSEETITLTKEEVLQEWAGDEINFLDLRAELREAAAAEELKQAELDLADTMRALGAVSRETHRLRISEARKVRDQLHTKREASRSEVTRLRLEQKAAKADLLVAEQEVLSRLGAFHDLTRIRSVRARQQGEAEDLVALTNALTDVTPEEVAFSRDLLREADIGLLPENLLADEVAAAAQRPAPRTPNLAAARSRLQAINEELTRAQTRAEHAASRAAKADRALKSIQARLDTLEAARDGIRDSARAAGKAAKAARKAAKRAARERSRVAKATPLWKAVRDITESIGIDGRVPHRVIDQVAREPGRVKARRLILTPEQRRSGEAKGFLRTDLGPILQSQYDQAAGYIGLTEALDLGPGRTYESWEDVLRAVDEDYRGGTQEAERAAIRKDLIGLKNRVLGTTDAGVDRDGWLHWLAAKARQFNFVRFGGGFGLTSLTDIGSIHLQAGPLSRLMRKHGGEMLTTLRRAHEANPTEFRAFLQVVELGQQGSRIASLYDAEDTLRMFGVGTRGSRRRAATAAIDRAGRWASAKTNVISGMQVWNRSWKIMVGLYQSHRLRQVVGKFDDLTDRELNDLGSLGIGSTEARLLREMFDKYATKDGDLWDPGLEQWAEAGEKGRIAARAFRVALQRSMDRAVFTPGIGDTPLLMDRSLWQAFFQFQTYAFTFVNRFLAPAAQRIATERDAAAIASFGHLAWSGLVVVLGKDLVRGEDPSERLEDDQWGQTAFDVLDRSGAMGYLSPYVDSILKAPNPFADGESFGSTIGVQPSSRFSRNDWMDSLLGVQMGLYRDLKQLSSAIGEADRERIAKKGILLAPWNTQLRLGANLAEVLRD